MNIITLEEVKKTITYTQWIKLNGYMEDLLNKLEREDNGIKFIGFQGEYNKRKSVLVFECPQGHRFVKVFANTLKEPIRCKQCRHKNQDLALERINNYCKKNDLSFVRFTDEEHYTGSVSSTFELKCNKCEYVLETKYVYLNIHPPICKHCSGDKKGFDREHPAVLYVLGIYDKNDIIGIKYGVAKSLARRLLSIRQDNPNRYTFKPLHEVNFSKGEDALILEDNLKDAFMDAPRLSKQQLPIGYTETVKPEYLPELMHLIYLAIN